MSYPEILGSATIKTDEERALTGTWVIDEVRLAVQKGYRILEIHEVYEYSDQVRP